MGRSEKSIEYLKTINAIKPLLNDSAKINTVTTSLKALDLFFPYLLNHFAKNLGIHDFHFQDYIQLSTDEQNKMKKSWEDGYIPNELFSFWTNPNINIPNASQYEIGPYVIPKKIGFNAVEKAHFLTQWKDEIIKSQKKSGHRIANENTFLNYIWRIQGLFVKMGRNYAADPRYLQKLPVSTQRRGQTPENLTFIDILRLYDKLDKRNKLILKIMMYTGLQPADICLLKPEDFILCVDPNYYYVQKVPIKSTKFKNAWFLFIFPKSFVEEIKAHFEVIVTHHLKHEKKPKQIDEMEKNPTRYRKIRESPKFVEFQSTYDWNLDKKCNIFGSLSSRAIHDSIQRIVSEFKLNSEITPIKIRKLCYSRLIKVFPLCDKDLFDLWTQHQLGKYSRESLNNYIERLIPYIKTGAIPEAILLDTTEGYHHQIESIRKEMNDLRGIVEDLKSQMEMFKNK